MAPGTWGTPTVPLPFVSTALAIQYIRTSATWNDLNFETVQWAGPTITYSIPDVALAPGAELVGVVGGTGLDDNTYRDNYVRPTSHFVNQGEAAFELWDDLIAVNMNRNTTNGGNIATAGGIQLVRHSAAGTSAPVLHTENTDGAGNTINNIYGTASNTYTHAIAGISNVPARFDADDDFNLFAYGFETVLHEIGHTLGLSHAGPYNGNNDPLTQSYMQQDNRQYSVMSYNDPGTFYGGVAPNAFTNGADWGGSGFTGAGRSAATPMVYDIAAVQAIYGADTTTRTGNTTYGFNTTGFTNAVQDAAITTRIAAAHSFSTTRGSVFSIWDAGNGIDTLNASDFDHATETRGAFINLFAGGYSNIGFEDGNSGTRMLGNVGIAFGTIIENAIGTHDNDTIWGNDAGNVLTGGEGVDELYGFGGNDTIEGGAGADYIDGMGGTDYASYAGATAAVAVQRLSDTQGKVVGGGGHGSDTIYNIEGFNGSTYNDSMQGYEGADQFNGNSGNDQLDGGGGDDQLDGGYGNDTMRGGAGRDFISGGFENEGSDWAIFSDAPAGISFDMRDISSGKVAINGGDGAGDTIVYIENVEGTAYADQMIGDARNNIFVGGAGNDSLYGWTGNDTISGGAGADYIDGGEGTGDVLSFRGAGSAVSIDRASGKVYGGGWDAGDTYVNMEYFEGTEFDDSYYGNGEIDQFSGFDGNDLIRGAGGNDQLLGGFGNDTLDGGTGADLLQGGEFNEGSDWAVFLDNNSSVRIDLGNVLAGKVTGHGGIAENDTLVDIENIQTVGGFDNLIGNSRDNIFVSGDSPDVLRGAGGNDVLSGENGTDFLAGEAGNDTLYGGADGDLLHGDRAISLLPQSYTKFFFVTTTQADPANIGQTLSLANDPNIELSTLVPHLTVQATTTNAIDYYAINVSTAGAVLTLDIDNTTGQNDTVIRLLNSEGDQVAYNDDSLTAVGAGGSTSGANSFLRYTVATAGTYIIQIGQFNGAGQAPKAFVGTASYELQVSVSGDNGSGSDLLFGGVGLDTLTGGAGADGYGFIRSELYAGANDVIADYNPGEGDYLVVKGGALAELGLTGSGLTRSFNISAGTNVLNMASPGNVTVHWYATEGAATLANGAIRNYDAAESGEWSVYTDYYDSQVRFDYQLGSYDSGWRAGGSWSTDTDQAGDQYYQYYRNEYDSAGSIYQQFGLVDDGRGWEFVFANGLYVQQTWSDVSATREWSGYVDVFDATGVLDYELGTYDTGWRAGGTWSYDVDQSGTNYFQWYRNEFNAAGVLYQQFGVTDDARAWAAVFANSLTTEQTWTDLDGSREWGSYTDYYAASGALDYELGTYDAGWRAGGSWSYDADQDGNLDFQWYRNEYNGAGQLYQQFGYTDDGRAWEFVYNGVGNIAVQNWNDVANSYSWSYYTDTLGSYGNGLTWHRVGLNDNGSAINEFF